MDSRNEETRYTLENIKSWRDSFNLLPQKINQALSQIEHTKTSIQESERALKAHQQQITKPLRAKLAKTNFEIYCFELQGKINKAQAELPVLDSHIKDNDVVIKSLQVEIDQLITDASKLSNRIKVVKLKNQIHERYEANANLKRDQPLIQQKMLELEYKLQELKVERETAKQQREKHYQKVVVLKKEVSQLKDQQQAQDMESVVSEVKNDANSGGYTSSSRVSLTQQMTASTLSGYHSSSTKVMSADQLTAAIAAKEDQIKAQKEHISKLNHVIRFNQNDFNDMKVKLDEQQSLFNRNRKRISLAEENIAFSRKQIEEYSSNTEEESQNFVLSELLDQSNKMRLKLDALREKQASKINEKESKENDYKDLSENLTKWQKDAVKHQDKIKKLHEEVALSVLHSRSQSEREELTQAQKVEDEFKAQLRLLNQKLVELEDQNHSLKKTLQDNTDNQYLTILDKKPQDMLNRLISDVSHAIDDFEKNHAYAQSLHCRLFLEHLNAKLSYYSTCPLAPIENETKDELIRKRYFILIGMLAKAALDINFFKEQALSTMMDAIFYSHFMDRGEMMLAFSEVEKPHDFDLINAKQLLESENREFMRVLNKFVLDLRRLDSFSSLAIKEVKGLGFDLVDDLKVKYKQASTQQLNFQTKYCTRLLSAANDLLLNPLSHSKRESYRHLLQQHPVEKRSAGYKIAGIALMLLGAILAAATVLVGVFSFPVAAPVYCAIATGAIATGALGGGFGLFYHGRQSTMYEDLDRFDKKIVQHQEKLINQSRSDDDNLFHSPGTLAGLSH